MRNVEMNKAVVGEQLHHCLYGRRRWLTTEVVLIALTTPLRLDPFRYEALGLFVRSQVEREEFQGVFSRHNLHHEVTTRQSVDPGELHPSSCHMN